MIIRPFDWRDLPALHRYRNQSVFLHSSLVLTKGPWLLSGAILSSLTSSSGIYTSVSRQNGDTDHLLIAQAIHTPGSQNVQLTFLAPDAAMDSASLPALLEHISSQIVDRGGFRLLADVDEHAVAFEALRQAGFAIYARQRVWKLPDLQELTAADQEADFSWRPSVDKDLISVRSLYNNLIPGLVQQVEPFTPERLHGYVYRQGEDLLAYMELKQGPRGSWVQPFIHPDIEGIQDRLRDFLANLPNRATRPVYLCVRSYQAWLEMAIETLGAEPSPRQAIMVKHLAIPQKVLRPFALPALEGGRPEVSAPLSHSQHG